jgi:hypothetical protein
LLIAELETRVEQLKASEVDMKNLFCREKEAREVLEYDYKQLAYECDKHMELRIASGRDLINCYKSLQKLNEDCEKLRGQLKELEEAALPIARLLVPHPGGPKIAPLVDRLREAPGRLVRRPRFSAGLINPNDPVNSVDFGQTMVNLGHHVENITDKP